MDIRADGSDPVHLPFHGPQDRRNLAMRQFPRNITGSISALDIFGGRCRRLPVASTRSESGSEAGPTCRLAARRVGGRVSRSPSLVAAAAMQA